MLLGSVLVAQSPLERDAEAQALTVLDRFLTTPVASLLQYRARRHLEARNLRFKKHGWMDAITELSSNGEFTYTVVDEGGSDYIRRKVLMPILDGERNAIARGELTRSALTVDNYHFFEEADKEPGVVRLLVRPKRREVTLIEGTLFVTSTDANLVRLTGHLAKCPSFWTKRVEVVRRYEHVAGVRVPVALESVAQVRIAGSSMFSMTYSSETVNGIAVSSEVVAKPAK